MDQYTCTPGVSCKQKKGKEWAKWIDTLEWSYYCTFTTRYSLSVNSARRSMERLFQKIRAKFPGLRMLWAAEPNASRSGCHIHALVYSIEESKKLKWVLSRSWQIVSGKNQDSYCIVEPFFKGRGGPEYMTKYFEHPKSEYDLLID
jgi:hypothetical protein